MRLCKRIFGVATVGLILVATQTASAQDAVSFATSSNRQTFRGETAGSNAGVWLDRGEVSNGDSRRDLIVGAPQWQSSTGRVYVVFSGPVVNTERALSAADAIFTGLSAGDRFGEATAAGYVTSREQSLPLPQRDLIIGAPGVNGNAGAAYLYLRGLTNGQRASASDAVLTITGAPAGARLGASLATGDLDGDGYREIIVGAPGTGTIYVVYGGPSVAGTVNVSVPSAAFFTITGASADGVGRVLASGDFLGHAGPTLPGVNSIYDLAIGAPFESANTGAVYVIAGRTSRTFPAAIALASADLKFTGIDPGDQAGSAIQFGYTDRDRSAELIIGAYMADGPGNARANAGEIYMLWGGATQASRSLSTADVTIFGADTNYLEGRAIAIGDVNRDGWSDFIALASGISAAGDLHLFMGRSRALWATTIDLRFVFPDIRFHGDTAAGPITATALYDLTGEGFDDVAVGIPSNVEGLVQVSYMVGPSIIEAPLSHTVNPNVLTTFLSDGTGNPATRVQWQVSSDGGVTWTNIAGATSASYSFVATPADNNKRYRAAYSNALATTNTGAAILGVRSVFRAATRADFDGDTQSDVMVWRPSTGTWYALTSGSAFNAGVAKQWGNASLGDLPFQADIDGDGIADLIVWRPGDGTWYWLTSGSGYSYAAQGSRQWGNSGLGDQPMVGDVDGDGLADLIIWRASTGTWYWLTSSSGYSYAAGGGIQWGNPSLGDRPVLGDYDGDGRADLAVWRASTGTWYWLTSSTNYSYASARGIQWGNNGLGDKIITGDIDGDAKADLILWRPTDGTWYWLTSSTGYAYSSAGSKQWGNNGLGDLPMIGDFDGDGRADLTIWRTTTGTWYWLTSSSGYSYSSATGRQWGGGADVPMVK